jgi:hypothetical protein
MAGRARTTLGGSAWTSSCKTRPMRTVASVLLLTVGLGACGCGGQGSTASAKHAPLEIVAHHDRCPRSDAQHESSPDPATAEVLVPAHPTGALICRYWGSHDQGREFHLAQEGSATSRQAVDRMAQRLNALPPMFRGPHSCPVFGERSVLIFFHYSHASDDPVRIVVFCLIPVSNGRIVNEGLGGLGSVGEIHWPDEGLLSASVLSK